MVMAMTAAWGMTATKVAVVSAGTTGAAMAITTDGVADCSLGQLQVEGQAGLFTRVI
jgi:hypothetical protein